MDISIIIVNWNTKELLQKCLHSIQKEVKDIAYEVIIVDNASVDDSVAMVRNEFPSAILICNNENRGFGAANNQALRVARGKYALLLNSDTLPTKNAAGKLFAFIERRTDTAIVCGQLLNADGSKQNSIASFPSLLTLIVSQPLLEYLLPHKFPSKRYNYSMPIEVDSAIGACMLVRMTAIQEVGLFDECYFFFFEETDLAYVMRKKGWKVFYIPDAFIYHFQGQSIGHNERSRMEFYRSRYSYFRKWKSAPMFILIVGIVFLRLCVNWFSSLVSNIATLFLSKSLRRKLAVYSHIILRHRELFH